MLKSVFRNRRFRDRDVAIVTCMGLDISTLQLKKITGESLIHISRGNVRYQSQNCPII